MKGPKAILVILATVVTAAACGDGGGPTAMDPGDGPAGPGAEPAVLTSVSPVGPNVDFEAHVEVRFSHPMDEVAGRWIVVHTGDLTGPIVEGTWKWSDDHTHLAFDPDVPWTPGVEYVIHLGGGMHDAFDHPLDFESHGVGMGGEWASEGMMGGDPMMMEPGWRHANGSYGMVFRFTAGS